MIRFKIDVLQELKTGGIIRIESDKKNLSVKAAYSKYEQEKRRALRL